MRTANERLQNEVLDELRWDPEVDVSAIGIAASDGVVTLYGEVPSWTMKVAAADAAARVDGVRAVAERLTLRCPGSLRRTDTELARDIARTLRQAGCPPSIKAHVQNGDLRLEGFVDWPFQRDGAESALADARPRLSGLRNVSNDIIVSQPATLPTVLDRPAGVRKGAPTVR
jgi:osmotically-inducible protein OsmY